MLKNNQNAIIVMYEIYLFMKVSQNTWLHRI